MHVLFRFKVYTSARVTFGQNKLFLKHHLLHCFKFKCLNEVAFEFMKKKASVT